MNPRSAGPIGQRLVIIALAVAALTFIGFGVQAAMQHGRPWWPSVVVPLVTGAVAGLIVWLNRRRVRAGGQDGVLRIGLPALGLVLIGFALYLIYGT